MNKYAVVIGVGSGGDATLMARRILKKADFTVKLLKDRKATLPVVVQAVDWLVQTTTEDDEAVFFFSGHGLTDKLALKDSFLTAAQLRSLLLPLKSHKVFIAIQACYSGSFINDLEGVNRVVVSSAQPDTWSVDNTRYSLWGYKFLLQGIVKGLADTNEDGLVSMQEAYAYSSLGMMSDQYGQPFYL